MEEIEDEKEKLQGYFWHKDSKRKRKERKKKKINPPWKLEKKEVMEINEEVIIIRAKINLSRKS